MIYDLIIIGGSAAATAAGIYAARRKLNFIVVSKDIGGEVATSGEVENYPGFIKTNGIELSEKFKEHLASYQVIPDTVVEVKNIKKEGNKFILEAKKDEKPQTYQAKSVIIATGVKPRKLRVPGEKEYEGKGVSYCTVCDGPLYQKKITTTIGGGNSALESALMMSQIATKVYLVTINSEMVGENTLMEKAKAADNIEIITNAETTKILGEQFVTGLEYQDKNSKETKKLVTSGIFIHIGMIPNSQMANAVEKNEFKEIVVDQVGKTNIEGLFAAGDVTNIPYKQIAIATGMGVSAALAAVDYLNRLKE